MFYIYFIDVQCLPVDLHNSSKYVGVDTLCVQKLTLVHLLVLLYEQYSIVNLHLKTYQNLKNQSAVLVIIQFKTATT
jgi:hypothetical protein